MEGVFRGDTDYTSLCGIVVPNRLCLPVESLPHTRTTPRPTNVQLATHQVPLLFYDTTVV